MGLVGYTGISVGWLAAPLRAVPYSVVVALAILSSGLFVLGVTLVVHVWLKGKVERARLLVPPTGDGGNQAGVIWNDVPTPPGGYRDLRPLLTAPAGYQHLLWLVPAFPLFWVFMVVRKVFPQAGELSTSPDGLLTVGSFLGALVAMFVVHELVHAGVARLLGYSAGFRLMFPVGVAVVIDGTVLRRSEQLAITGAPLVVVTLGFAAGGVVANGWIAPVLFTIALFNLVASSADLYTVLTVLQLPPETLLYYPHNDAPIGVYEPTESPPSRLRRLEQQAAALIGPTE